MVSPDSTLTMDYLSHVSTPKTKKATLSSSSLTSPTKSPGKKSKKSSDKDKSSKSPKKTKDLVSPKSKSSKKKSSNMNSLDFVSPTGVADFLQVEEMEALNNSFSWVDSADVGPTAMPNKTLSMSEQMHQVRERMDWLQQQRRQDKIDLQDNLDKAKRDLKKELKKVYDPLIKQTAASSTQEKSVKDMSKLIEYLRNDNAKIREEMVFYKKEMKRLLISNNQLEEANKKAMASLEELREHVMDLEAAQAKLQENCDIFKGALKKMKDDYKKRNSHYMAECNTLDLYEHAVAKVLAAAKKNGSLSSKQPKLLEQVQSMAQEGAMEASMERQEHLTPLGLSPEKRKNHLFSNDDEDADDAEESDDESDSDSD